MIKAAELVGKSNREIIDLIGPLCTADMHKSGVLASVTLAQFCLESGYGKSELAQNANNCFGMKCNLSNNGWTGSAWDGQSKYTKQTWEVENGKDITITADFRKYKSVEESISDHSAYLVGAKNGKKNRYEGIVGMTNYRKAAELIKAGGYATDPKYTEKLCQLIESNDLTRFDTVLKVQVGSYSIMANAEKMLDEIKSKGYSDAFIVELRI